MNPAFKAVAISNNNPSPDNAALLAELFSAKKVLFIGAHPDDIEFYCAGLVQLWNQRGAQVTFAVATRGGKGRTGRAKARLEDLRSAHQHDAATILGGAKIILFDYPDKSLPDFIEPFSNDLRRLIADLNPDLVFSWDPEYIYNPHPDHQAAADAAKLALKDSKVCYYGTREPNLWIGFGEDIFKIKLKSIRAHRTETPWYFWPLAKRCLLRKSIGEGAKVGEKYAEVYRVRF